MAVVEYYFDTETTGFDFEKDKIITIQWQRLDGFTGEPIGELNILKEWKSSEKEILKTFVPNLLCRLFDFILVGKNLLFDFCILSQKMKQYKFPEFDLRCVYQRVSLDIKPILVMMNNGDFNGYDKIIPKTNLTKNDKIPKLYEKKKFPEILQYIKDETEDFLKAYQMLKKEIPQLRCHLNT